MTYTITVAGIPVEIISDVNISRSSSDLITSCSFSVSASIVDLCRLGSRVIVKVPTKTVFIGVIFDYQIQYQGCTPILNVNCADFAYRLSHADVCADFASIGDDSLYQTLYFNGNSMLGDAIEYLLTGSGISAERVGAREIECPYYETSPGQTRYSVIQDLCSLTNCLFWLEFDGDVTVAICESVPVLTSQDRYSLPVAVSDSSHLVEACSIESVPEMNCTRVVVYDGDT